MQNILKHTAAAKHSNAIWLLLLILVAYVIVGLFLFSFIGYAVVAPFFGFDFQQMMVELQNPYDDSSARTPLLIIQGLSSLGAFIIAPMFFIRRNLKLSTAEFLEVPKPILQPILVTTIAVLSCMVVNSTLIEWNQNFSFPDFMSGFEQWALSKEKQMEALTLYLTEFDSFGQYLIALFVIAMIPAIGEELLFRGIIQNIFHNGTRNPHIAIWVTAFIFSAFHLQFYGLIPRMMLGVLFGYLYWWSGHLSLAMLGHFINNAFSVTIFYLSHINLIEMSPTDFDKTPPIYVILLFLITGGGMLYLFKKYFSIRASHE